MSQILDDKTKKSREKVKSFLKANGKDAEKFIPESQLTPPADEGTGPDSSSDKNKPTGDQLTEDQKKEQARLAAEKSKAAATKAEEAKKAEEKRILDAEESTLSADDKKKKSEILVLKQEERESAREAKVQKRIDEVVGKLKNLEAEKSQDKATIETLKSELNQLKGKVDNNPEKVRGEIARLEKERIITRIEADKAKKREDRLEMSNDELNEWMAEDLVGAQTWLADRQLRRRDERKEDEANFGKPSQDEIKARAKKVIDAQDESQSRVAQKYPGLDMKKAVARGESLKAEGKTKAEVKETLSKEFPDLALAAQIAIDDPDTYAFSENGPELVAEEVMRRKGKSQHTGETEEEKEARIRQEAIDAERSRLEGAENGSTSTRGKNPPPPASEFEGTPLYSKQLSIWKTSFPNLSDAEVKAKLDKALKRRREQGLM